jgi:uncharacterized protein YndB with AHSA1/START domain
MTDRYRVETMIEAPPEHVFEFLVDPDLLIRWLGISAHLDPVPGGEFRFEIAPGEWCSGVYLEVDPPKRVVLTWGWESGRIQAPPGSSRVEIDLHPEGEGTRLVLLHHGLSGDALRLHADGWPRFLRRLDAAARGLEPKEEPATETPEQALERLESQ